MHCIYFFSNIVNLINSFNYLTNFRCLISFCLETRCRSSDELRQTLIGKSWNFALNNYLTYSIGFDSTGKSKILTEVVPSSWKIVPGLCGQGISFESTANANHFLRHKGFVFYLALYENKDLYKNDACFKLVPGLAACDQISLQSVNYPDKYLRHQDFVIKLHSNDGSSWFRADATFKEY